MNNTFDIKRFGNYFLYDLSRARGNFMWSAIVLVLLPAIFFAVVEFFSLLFKGEFATSVGVGTAPIAAIVVYACSILTFPVKMYGSITDKRAGSDYLMIPASTFEKWLTMILMSCVVMPMALTLAFFAVDGLMALCFGKFYGTGLISSLEFIGDMHDINFGDVSLLSHALGFSHIEWICSILIFTLGAICFKTSKVGKTLLTIILISSVVGTIFSSLLMLNIDAVSGFFASIDGEEIDSLASLFNHIIWLGWAWYVIQFSALAGAIYYRLRTLTH